MRDRIIELIESARYWGANTSEKIADRLLAEGVIMPPVRVGQTVYSNKGTAYIIEGVHYKNGRFLFGGNKCDAEGAPQRVWFETDIGKTVFLTREEAEKALERSENEYSSNMP